MSTYNIGRSFSTDPCGRYYSDKTGASGEQFREEELLPQLQKLTSGEKLTIVLDDEVESYGSSFLTEGFAGVVKFGHMKNEELLSVLEFKYEDPDFEFYKDRITLYISQAKYNSEKYVSTK